MLWIILTAFKTYEDALAVPAKFIFTPTLANFSQVFSRAYSAGGQAQNTGFTLYFFNSLFISGVSVLLALLIGTLAAFGFSRYPLKGNDTYLFMILSTRMLPAIVVIIPIFIMFRVTGLAGTYLGIIALYTAFNLPFAIWMMKSFFDELSLDVEDAARIDGSSDIRVFFKICLPQVIAGLAATAVFGLILTWNEFLFALLLSGVETRTVPVAMSQTIGGDIGVRWGLAGGHRDVVPDSRHHRDFRAAESTAARRDLRHRQALSTRRPDVDDRTQEGHQAVRLVHGRARRRSLRRGGRSRLSARALGLRQDDDAAHHRRPRTGDLGRRPDRRQADEPPAARAARHRDGVPVLRALSRA